MDVITKSYLEEIINLIKQDYNKKIIPKLETHAYGIEWEKGSSVITRIGNLEMHKDCTISNKLKGCLHDGKEILHWLNPDGWGLPMDNGEIPILDGTAGDVGVAFTDPWYVKVYNLETKYQVYISEYNIDGTWIKITPCIYSHDKSMTRINADGKEEAFSACISKDDETHIGGNKDTNYISKLHGRPRTGVDILTAIEFCNNRSDGRQLIDYLHWCSLQLLYYIEYANFDCQLPVNKNLTTDGFKQGGLGVGVTKLNWTNLSTYNGNNPIVETNFKVIANVGNKSYCDIDYDLNEYQTLFKVKPSYFHGLCLFGDVWTFIGDIIVITDINDNTKANVYKLKSNVTLAEITNDNILDKCIKIGVQYNRGGWINEFDLSNGPYFIPVINGNSTKGDYNYNNRNGQDIRILILGGGYDHGTQAGIGAFHSNLLTSYSNADVGFMTMLTLD